MVSRIWAFVQDSKVLVDRGLIMRGNTGIEIQRGINCGNVVSNRWLRGFSSTSSLDRSSVVVSGRGVRSSSSVISSKEWDWLVCLSMQDLNTIKDFSWAT